MRNFALIAAVSAVSAGTVQAAPKHRVDHAKTPPTVSGSTSLTQTLNSARAYFNKDDQFAGPPVFSARSGEVFRIELPTDPDRWTYKGGNLSFAVPVEMADTHFVKTEYPKLLTIHDTSRDLSGYIGSNAFGATRDVDVKREKEDSLALLSTPDGVHDDYAFSVDLQAAPAAAKALTKTIHVVIEGTFGALPDGPLAECQTAYSGATFDHPTDLQNERCWVGVNVVRVAYVNSATGEILKEFKKKEPTADELLNRTKYQSASVGALDPDNAARYYPERALRNGQDGSATITCTVSVAGHLSECVVVAEEPADYGFGEAALKCGRTMSGDPQVIAGQPTASRVTFTINFHVPS